MSSHPQQSPDRRYYFISDLHIGGDEQLQNVEFEAELIEFLRGLETSDEDAELIVNGDAFGLWEFTELEGMEKFDALVERYPNIFEQFRATGERIPITFIPGNHDYELACYPEYVDRLAAYNVTLEREVVITREVGDRVVWVEHGQQRDQNNESPDFGNPYANPPGYFVNQHITSRAGRLSARGRFNWLKDIQSVTPMTEIPDWMISKYFYREMSPFLRYAALPFLLLFNVSVLYLALFLLAALDLWSEPLQLVDSFIRFLGIAGVVVDVVLAVNIVVILILTVLAVPLFFLVRDVRKTLTRFGLVKSESPKAVSNAYVEGAKAVFEAHPAVAVFVYGHTHRASLTEVGDRAVVNTGTWLKRLHRRSVLFGLLPPVYYSSFRLNYFVIGAEDGAVTVEYHRIEKGDPNDLTYLERLLTLQPSIEESIPDRTVVGTEWHPTEDEPRETPVERASTDDNAE